MQTPPQSTALAHGSDLPPLLPSSEFVGIRRILIDRAMLAFQIIVVIFIGLMSLILFFPTIDAPYLSIVIIASTIDVVVIWILRRTLIHTNTILSTQIFIITTLILAFIVSIAASSVTVMLIVAIMMALTTLPLNSIKFTVFSGLFSVVFYCVTLIIFSGGQDLILHLTSPFGEIMNTLVVCLGYAAVVMFILLLSRLLQSAVGQAEHLADRSEQLRLVEIHNNKELSEQFHEQQRLIEIVKTLEVPIIPLIDGIIVVPLVGGLDTARMQAIQQRVLEAVNMRQSKLVILEMTGVPIIDTHTASQLVHLAQAVRLLGTQTVLTGMQSEIAITLVRIGVDLGDIGSYASIQSILERYMPTQSKMPL